jgi:hypothetical protein
MTAWVLIFVFKFGGAITTDFETKQLCENAKTAVTQQWRGEGICVQKTGA